MRKWKEEEKLVQIYTGKRKIARVQSKNTKDQRTGKEELSLDEEIERRIERSYILNHGYREYKSKTLKNERMSGTERNGTN